jgi:hypothetical protein
VSVYAMNMDLEENIKKNIIRVKEYIGIILEKLQE